MAKRKRPADDLKFEVVYGREMTEEELTSMLEFLANMLIENWMSSNTGRQENNVNQDSDKRNDQSPPAHET